MLNDDSSLNHTDQVALAESLMHYLLTTMMLPSQRKIKINGIEISVIIPDLRNFKKNPEQVLFIQFVNTETSDAQSIVRSLKTLHPIHANIWVISYMPLNVPSQVKNYYISKPSKFIGDDKMEFSRIMYDVGAFIDKLNGFHFKVF
jgi:hypothetical protein